jgi:hypothetical protein
MAAVVAWSADAPRLSGTLQRFNPALVEFIIVL